jgi:putative peptidoglycan lipid II flippase
MKKEKTAKDVATVLLGNSLGLVLGFVSSVIVAAYFGAGKQLDAFMAAYAIPDLLSQIMLSVSILLVVPIFIEYRTNEGINSAMAIVNKFITISLCILCIGTLFFILFSSFILKLSAPGFDRETHELSCNLLRMLSFSILLYGCWALTSSILQAQEHFVSPALAGPIMQILTIFIVVLLSRQVGVYAYAIGTLIGLFFGLVVQLPPLLKRGRFQINFGFSHPALKSIWAGLPPLLLTRLLGQGTRLFVTAVASTLAVGSISSLNFAWKIVGIPIMIMSSLSVVLYPSISEEIARKDFDTLKRILMKAIKVSVYIGVPFTVFLILFRVPIVRALFERGKFSLEQSFLTAEVLMFYSIMIVFQSINSLIGNTYWALRLMNLRLKIEVAGIIVCILLCLLLSRYLGPGGLALSISIQYVFLTVIGLRIIKKRVPIEFDMGELMNYGLKVTMVSILSGLTTKMVMYPFYSFINWSLWGKISYMMLVGLIGGISYVLFCFLLRIEENKEMLVLIMNKVIHVRKRIIDFWFGEDAL